MGGSHVSRLAETWINANPRKNTKNEACIFDVFFGFKRKTSKIMPKLTLKMDERHTLRFTFEKLRKF